jgi:hypothetical protein
MLHLYTCSGGRRLGENGSTFVAWGEETSQRNVRISVPIANAERSGFSSNTYDIHDTTGIVWDNHVDEIEEVDNMTRKEKFYHEKIKKSAMSLKGIASLITHSFEVESMTGEDEDDLKRNLRDLNGGTASNKQVNDGNGWNNDCHHDGSLTSSSNDNGGCYGTETSASPIDIVSYSNIKSYLDGILETYKQASGGVYHTYYGSTHVHSTISYYKDGFDYVSAVDDIDAKKVYNNVGRFFLKFGAVMKWLSMTDKDGARAVRGTSYDLLDNDRLFYWWNNYDGSMEQRSTTCLREMSRDSYLRIMGNAGQIHFENRMCDTTFNSTHLAMWLSINKAIMLFAIDFARKDYLLPITNEDVNKTKNLYGQHRDGYKYVPRDVLETLYKEFVSYLVKYLKITNSLEVIPVMDKLIKCPISQWIDENGYDKHWNTDLIEKVFNTRNRASDTVLREKFLHAIQFFEVNHCEKLEEFLSSMAKHLEVEEKKVKSLYQMFSKENQEIYWLGGRLVYLGE